MSAERTVEVQKVAARIESQMRILNLWRDQYEFHGDISALRTYTAALHRAHAIVDFTITDLGFNEYEPTSERLSAELHRLPIHPRNV